MAIISTVDNESNVWTSLLIGDYGFVSILTPGSLALNKELIYSDRDDVLFQNITVNGQIGSLFIELNTRRRFRINGIASDSDNYIMVKVQESYPNCPKYIQQRVLSNPESFTRTEATKNHRY